MLTAGRWLAWLWSTRPAWSRRLSEPPDPERGPGQVEVPVRAQKARNETERLRTEEILPPVPRLNLVS
jgi:hypothetical protein